MFTLTPVAHFCHCSISRKTIAHGGVEGGAASVLGGGKFANGAVTGAFVYIANDAAHKISLRQIANVLDKLSVLTLDSTRADFEAVSVGLPKFARTIFVAGNVAAARYGALNASYEQAYDTKTGELQHFGEVAMDIGIQAGGSLEVGFINGSLQDDFFGRSLTIDVDFGKSLFKPKFGLFSGGGVIVVRPFSGRSVFGAYASPAGFSTLGGSITYTNTIPYTDESQ